VLWNPDSPAGVLELKEVERAAEVLNIQLRKREWRRLEELPTLISAITGQVDAGPCLPRVTPRIFYGLIVEGAFRFSSATKHRPHQRRTPATSFGRCTLVV
jgi:hypothetical protein